MRLYVRFLAAAAAAAVLTTAGCGGSSIPDTGSDTDGQKAADTGTPATSPAPERIIPANIPRHTVPIQETSAYSTILTAKSRVIVISRVPGMIEAVYAEEGTGRRWRRDGLLATIESSPYMLAYQKAGAEADRARAIYEHNRNASEGYSGEFDVEIVSELDVKIAKSDYLKAQADSALKKMELDYTEIRAPISGYIAERRIQAGQWVGVQEELFTIVDLDTLRAVAIVPYTVLNALGPVDRVTLQVNPGDEPITVQGELLLRGPVLLPPTGGVSGVKITVQVINRDRRLRPGMPAEIMLSPPER